MHLGPIRGVVNSVRMRVRTCVRDASWTAVVLRHEGGHALPGLRYAGQRCACMRAAEQPWRFATGGLRPPPYADAPAPATGAVVAFSGKSNRARSSGRVK